MGNPQEPIGDLVLLLENLVPEVLPGQVVFVALKSPDFSEGPWLAWVQEPEGPTAVVRIEDARRLGLEYDSAWAWITLSVHSDLESIGLTARISAALAEAEIPCNVIAGMRHDHVLVPSDRLAEAVSILSGPWKS